MAVFACTGPRKLTPNQQTKADKELRHILTTCEFLHIGDATGLDSLAQQIALQKQVPYLFYEKYQHLHYRARCAERSTRMVKALAAVGGTLHAWPNKNAPATLSPAKSWPKGAQGSGTWGTISLAVGLGLTVEIHPLEPIELPDWLTVSQTVGQQMTLI